jgi:hypothetical protein
MNKPSFRSLKYIILSAQIALGMGTAHASCQKIMAGLFRHQKRLVETPEVELFKKVGRIEKTTNLLRKLKENPEPALNIRVWKKIAVLDSFLYNGSHAPNERQWRTFFREFEANYVSYQRSQKVVDYLLKNPNSSPEDFFKAMEDLEFSEEYIYFLRRQLEQNESLERLRIALELEKESTLTHLGNHYQEYRMVRGHLEELASKDECTENCQRYTNYLLGSLGAPSDKEQLMFKLFFDGRGRPVIKDMREALYQEPTFVLTRLKRERNAELLGFLKGLISQPEFLDTILGYIYKSKILEKRRAVKLFRMIYDAQAKNNHFPKINRVIYGPDTPDQSLDLLENINSAVEGDELLATFARRVDTGAQKKWSSLIEEAKKSQPDLHKRMLEATEKAQARGDLSPTSNRSFVGRLAALVVIGVPAVGYFYFDGLPTSVEEFLYGVSEDEHIETAQPRPDSMIEVELNGEEDETLEEVSEVITNSESDEGERGPSSVKKALFTKWWCQHFNCRP